jgi:hypothetical protein
MNPPPRRKTMAEGAVKLAGKVKTLIDSSVVDQPEQVQISLLGADLNYDELRCPNTHKWQVGDLVEVTIRSH